MRIRLSHDPRRAVILDRSMLEDTRLSFRAKGLLAYLLLHPELDLSRSKQLSAVSLEGVDAIQTAFRELEDAGYLRRTAELDEAGRPQPVLIVSPVSRIPILETIPASEEPVRHAAVRGAAKPSRDTQGRATAAERVVSRLNELRSTAWDWARYTPLSAKYAKNVEHINGRLTDGFSENDLVLVLEYLAAEDGGKEASRKYFDCVTPFNTKNFERNLALAREWDARGRPVQRVTSKHHYEQSHDPSIYDRGRRGGSP